MPKSQRSGRTMGALSGLLIFLVVMCTSAFTSCDPPPPPPPPPTTVPAMRWIPCPESGTYECHLFPRFGAGTNIAVLARVNNNVPTYIRIRTELYKWVNGGWWLLYRNGEGNWGNQVLERTVWAQDQGDIDCLPGLYYWHVMVEFLNQPNVTYYGDSQVVNMSAVT